MPPRLAEYDRVPPRVKRHLQLAEYDRIPPRVKRHLRLVKYDRISPRVQWYLFQFLIEQKKLWYF